ncbi:carbohydrate kinase [Flavonifractor sp. An100]|uniref:carbohydrate kinase family protein n=1 Tax=Flavonifractor sp. An100 TaxID=1965538 RepID=UPI000B374D47|nr:carbohydrate kinase [Flavonifractor sp. An100]OUQ81697.1 carbohydrate kinase [Flavonifractor sp. An100]
MYDITSIGELLIDLTQVGVNEQGVGLFAANPGGAPANVAVAAARLGCRCSFLGKVGRDGFGDSLLHTLQSNGVDPSNVYRGEQATTMAVVTISPSGERSFRFLRGADQSLTVQEVAGTDLSHTKFLHFGSVSLTPGASRSATLFAARQARSAGALISYDPNFRPSLWDSRESAVQWMALPLPLVDILKLSDEELPLIAHTSNLEKGTLELSGLGVRLIMVTLGAKGVYYRWGDSTGLVPGVPVSVADTNGAGDTFLGAVLRCLALRPEGPLEQLQTPELEQILTFANRAAALTCSRSGAIPAMPTLAELE